MSAATGCRPFFLRKCLGAEKYLQHLPAGHYLCSMHSLTQLLLLVVVQLHASGSPEAGCNGEGKLQLGQKDLLSIFITSTAEMPGMLFASLLVDYVGRKR